MALEGNSYLVEGSGYTYWNGVYTYDGIYNGYASFIISKGGGWIGMEWDGSNYRWSFTTKSQIIYQGGINPLDPTDGDWVKGQGEGTPPYPIVTLIGGGTPEPTPTGNMFLMF